MTETKKTPKKVQRAAALAEHLADVIEHVPHLTGIGRPKKRRHSKGHGDPYMSTECAFWRSAEGADSKTSFNVRLWYTDSGDEQGRLFEVTVKEVSDD